MALVEFPSAPPPGPGLTDLKRICAQAVAEYQFKAAALERAARELAALVTEAQAQGRAVTGDRALAITRLVIGTFHAALEAHQAEVSASRQGRQ